MVLIKLNSDNFEDELLTVDAYEEACLQMSSGDWATHRAELIIVGKHAFGETDSDVYHRLKVIQLDVLLNNEY